MANSTVVHSCCRVGSSAESVRQTSLSSGRSSVRASAEEDNKSPNYISFFFKYKENYEIVGKR